MGDLSIDTVEGLTSLLRENIETVLKKESDAVARKSSGSRFYLTYKEREEKGVVYTHVGLARLALRASFGEARVVALLKNSEPHHTV